MRGGRRGGSVTTTWIQQCPAMSSRLSLCAGMEVPARKGSVSKAVRRRERRDLRGACAALLQGHLPMHSACPHTYSSCHTCCLLRQDLSCQSACSLRTSATWFFPAGLCGGFFRGQEGTTRAMSRQNQFVAVFYTLSQPEPVQKHRCQQ